MDPFAARPASPGLKDGVSVYQQTYSWRGGGGVGGGHVVVLATWISFTQIGFRELPSTVAGPSGAGRTV